MSVPPLGRGPPSPPAPASVCGVEGSLPGEACGAWPCLRRLSRGETPPAGLVLAAPGEEEAGGGVGWKRWERCGRPALPRGTMSSALRWRCLRRRVCDVAPGAGAGPGGSGGGPFPEGPGACEGRLCLTRWWRRGTGGGEPGGTAATAVKGAARRESVRRCVPLSPRRALARRRRGPEAVGSGQAPAEQIALCSVGCGGLDAEDPL